MPVLLHLAQLVFEKKLLDHKYYGGCDQFRIDYNTNNRKFDQEDDELLCIVQMNFHEFDYEKLIEHGLEANDDMQYSNDYVAVSRYGGALWETDWLEYNGIFAWHSECNPAQKERAVTIDQMTVSEIKKLSKKGIKLLETINSKMNIQKIP